MESVCLERASSEPGPKPRRHLAHHPPPPILQRTKLRSRDMEAPAPGHPVSLGQSQGSLLPPLALPSALPTLSCMCTREATCSRVRCASRECPPRCHRSSLRLCTGHVFVCLSPRGQYVTGSACVWARMCGYGMVCTCWWCRPDRVVLTCAVCVCVCVCEVPGFFPACVLPTANDCLISTWARARWPLCIRHSSVSARPQHTPFCPPYPTHYPPFTTSDLDPSHPSPTQDHMQLLLRSLSQLSQEWSCVSGVASCTHLGPWCLPGAGEWRSCLCFMVPSPCLYSLVPLPL